MKNVTVNLKKGTCVVNVLVGTYKATGKPAYFAQSSQVENNYYHVTSDEMGNWSCECAAHCECRHIKAVKLLVLETYRSKQAIITQAEQVAATASEYAEIETEIEGLKELYRDAAKARNDSEMALLESSILHRERRLEVLEEKQFRACRNTVQKIAIAA